MKNLSFDSGVKEFCINGGGVLRFNPSDPNLYTRFMDAMEEIRAVEDTLVAKAKEVETLEDRQRGGEAALRLMADADRQMKDILNRVFGMDNDFDAALGGVNVLAVAGNGQRVVTNLLQALQPVLLSGAESHTKQQVDAAVAKAKRSRAQRGAKA